MTERVLPLKNTITGRTERVPAAVYEEYINARDPSSGRHIWKPTESTIGILRAADGTMEEVLIPPERQREAVTGDPLRRPLSIWQGPGDPRRDQARRDSITKAQNKIAKDRGFAEVAADAALGVMTGGASSAGLNAIAGPDAGEFRAKSTANNTFPHLVGQLGGAAALGFMPVPGLGAAGRLVSGGAKGAANVGTIFEASAALSQTARGLIKGQGFLGEFGRRVAGTTVFAGAAEVPISLALASADLVDHNKPHTAQAVLANGFQQWQFAVGLAAITSLPLAALGAGIRVGSRKFATKAGELVDKAPAGSSNVPDSVVRGGIRYFSRKHTRGRFFGLGDIAETHAYKVGTKMVKGSGKTVSETGWGRWLTGSDADDFIRYHQTNRDAIVALGEARSGRQIVKASDTLLANVTDPEIASLLNKIKKSAHDIPAARRVTDQMIREGDIFAEKALKTAYKHPMKLDPVRKFTDPTTGTATNPTKMLQKTLDQARSTPGLSKDAIARIDRGIPENFMKGLEETLNIRKGIPPGSDARRALDRALVAGYKSKTKKTFAERLAEIDGLEDAAVAIRQQARAFQNTPRQASGVYSLAALQDFRAQLGKLNGTYRGLSNPKVRVIVDTKPFDRFYTKAGKKMDFDIDTKFNNMEDAVEALGDLNQIQSRLAYNAGTLVKARKPGTQAEILLSQVEAVMTTKTRVKSALEFIALKGGGARHTAAFGGVMTFREMQTLSEKRDAFAMYREILMATGSTTPALQSHVGKVVENAAAADMPLGMALADGVAVANQYLMQQMPKSDDPIIGPSDFSGAEIENWLEALGAAMEPISVLASAADGSTSSQAVDAIRTIYPDLYIDMVLDVAEFMDQHGGELGHAQLTGLDTFTGGALHYTDAPGPNLSYSLPGFQTTQQAASQGAVGGPENRRLDIQQNATSAQKLGGF